MGLTSSGRLLIVSNRLPIVVRDKGEGMDIVPASGGLATGLRTPHEKSGGLWFGWPGEISGLSEPEQAQLDRILEERRIVSIALSRPEVERYYEGFSNEVLWPLFHYLLDRVPIDARDWQAYVDVNRKFAEAVAGRYRPGDRIWIHDYHLCLVPGLLRSLVPEARIGFFLHIPFPSADVFRILPWRDQILKGLLGADLIGFHTFSYLRHFTRSLLEILGHETEVDHVDHEGRRVRLGVFPMGVDANAFQALAASPRVARAARLLRQESAGRRVVLSVDRLDYTKGIPRRLLAFERLLEKSPDWRSGLRFIQIAVPSRASLPEYQDYRDSVERLVGRINGAYATVDAVPIHYLYRSISDQRLAALYLACDVMLVTPLRDGMNLVAKEFAATRIDEDGVLVLSEFAGAASELGEALRVNSFDVDGMADTLARALAMPREERKTRMMALRERVRQGDVHSWVSNFLTALETAGGEGKRKNHGPGSGRDFERLSRELGQAPGLTLLLDYDGTLVPIADSPDLAAPDGELLDLLEALSTRPGTQVHVVSGRPKGSLEKWLGHLKIWLWAEHGFWSRKGPRSPWTPLFNGIPEWKERILPILSQFAGRTPGSLVEEKTSGLAWHYRMADPDFGEIQARKLRAHLAEALHRLPLEVLLGKKVVEVRLHGVNKGRVLESLPPPAKDSKLVAMGDEATDNDLFRVLPPGAFAIHVGSLTSRARYCLSDVPAVRDFLRSIAARPVISSCTNFSLSGLADVAVPVRMPLPGR